MISLRRSLMAVALAAAVLAVPACSGDETAGPSPTTGTTPSTTAASSGTTVDGTVPEPADTTVAPPPGGAPASSLPPVTTAPGAPGAVAACTALGDTLPLQELVPRDSSSWPDERMRIVVDARRDAALYDQAAAELPAVEAPHAQALATYAGWLADEVQGADSAAAARRALDAYPEQGVLAAANTEIDRWRSVNCA